MVPTWKKVNTFTYPLAWHKQFVFCMFFFPNLSHCKDGGIKEVGVPGHLVKVKGNIQSRKIRNILTFYSVFNNPKPKNKRKSDAGNKTI